MLSCQQKPDKLNQALFYKPPQTYCWIERRNMKNDWIKFSHILSIAGMLILVFTLSSCAIISSAKRVEDVFSEAEASYRSGDYNAAIKKYNVALEEFGKPGVVLGIRPHIDKNFLTLVNYRIATGYSKLAEQSDDFQELYNKAIIYVEKAALPLTNDKHKIRYE